MQQHTGQHIFSQAFVKLFNAPTRSFRVLDESCEIDVELDNPTSEIIERAVELANNVIWENRVITIKQVTSQEASELPLRKEPAREGDLRLIEIEGFDLTPCGGTHAYQTGEVGMIAVRSWERAKGLTRIEFVAGMRALADYRRANQSARAVAGLFSAGRADTPELAAHMIEENKQLHRRVRHLEEIAARVEAEELLVRATTTPDNMRIVNEVFDNRDAESLKQLAHGAYFTLTYRGSAWLARQGSCAAGVRPIRGCFWRHERFDARRLYPARWTRWWQTRSGSRWREEC